jgi:4-methylaminobutanoate oxidase (formaldehyde-forming)
MGRQNWFGPVGDEHAHVRAHAGVFDQSSFAKYELSGPKAAEALEAICANRVAREVGRLTYTQLLNSRGGIEADLTVARLAEDRFYIVTGTGFRTHDYGWIADHLPKSGVSFEDVTEGWGTLSLIGPRARDILAAVTAEDVSNAALPFGSARILTISGVKVRALRVTYVGELGWELHCPINQLGDVYDALMAADPALRPVGYRALESLRLEKGYRAWSSDITPNDTPFEAGLGWAVKLKSTTPFLGRSALEAAHGKPLTKSLMTFTVEDPTAVLVGRETVLRDGQAVGYLTSGGYGYSIGKSIGLGYVRNQAGVTEPWLTAGRYALVIAGAETPASLSLKPLIDPEGARIKA